MPTHEEFSQFLREFYALPPEKQEQFLKAVEKMVSDLRSGQHFDPVCASKRSKCILASSR